MKKRFFSLAFLLIGVVGFANTQVVNSQKSIIVENNNDKLKVSYKLGDVTNLTETEIITLIDNLSKGIKNNKDVDECTITLTAEINVGFGSVSVSVSYTASNCETALRRAGQALGAAVRQLKELAASW
jgi:3-isopropylmalate dehydratase small subunit